MYVFVYVSVWARACASTQTHTITNHWAIDWDKRNQYYFIHQLKLSRRGRVMHNLRQRGKGCAPSTHCSPDILETVFKASRLTNRKCLLPNTAWQANVFGCPACRDLQVSLTSHAIAHRSQLGCRFLWMFIASLLSTVRSVWLLSRIFMYAPSVSPMTLSYSWRVSVFRAIESLTAASLFVSVCKSCWIFAFSCSSSVKPRTTSSRFSLRSSIHLTRSWFTGWARWVEKPWDAMLNKIIKCPHKFEG